MLGSQRFLPILAAIFYSASPLDHPIYFANQYADLIEYPTKRPRQARNDHCSRWLPTTTGTNAKANNNGTRWKDYAEIYPPAKDIVEALQDLGKSMRLAHVQLGRVRRGSVSGHMHPALEPCFPSSSVIYALQIRAKNR